MGLRGEDGEFPCAPSASAVDDLASQEISAGRGHGTPSRPQPARSGSSAVPSRPCHSCPIWKREGLAALVLGCVRRRAGMLHVAEAFLWTRTRITAAFGENTRNRPTGRAEVSQRASKTRRAE